MLTKETIEFVEWIGENAYKISFHSNNWIKLYYSYGNITHSEDMLVQ